MLWTCGPPAAASVEGSASAVGPPPLRSGEEAAVATPQLQAAALIEIGRHRKESEIGTPLAAPPPPLPPAAASVEGSASAVGPPPSRSGEEAAAAGPPLQILKKN